MIFFKKIVLKLADSKKVRIFAPVKQKGRVAQLNRVADYGSAGYRFESCRGHFLMIKGRVAQLNRVADYGSAGYRFESCRDHRKEISFRGISFFCMTGMSYICGGSPGQRILSVDGIF